MPRPNNDSIYCAGMGLMIEALERVLRAALSEVEGWRQFLEQRQAQLGRVAEVGGEVSEMGQEAKEAREARVKDAYGVAKLYGSGYHSEDEMSLFLYEKVLSIDPDHHCNSQRAFILRFNKDKEWVKWTGEYLRDHKKWTRKMQKNSEPWEVPAFHRERRRAGEPLPDPGYPPMPASAPPRPPSARDREAMRTAQVQAAQGT